MQCATQQQSLVVIGVMISGSICKDMRSARGLEAMMD